MNAEAIADQRLHPASIWLVVIRRGIAPWLAPGAVFVAVNATSAEGGIRILGFMPLAIAAVLFGIVVTAVFSGLAWSRFKYGIDGRDIVIEHGLFTRVRRSIPLARVQDVNIEQGPLARILGLAKVKIETGGGAKDEGVLDCVSLSEADRLRRVIRAAGAPPPAPAGEPAAEGLQTTAEPAPPPGARLVFGMSPGRVLLSGLFGFSLFYLAAAFAVVETFTRFLPFEPFDPRTWRQLAALASTAALAWGVVAVLALGVVFGAGRVFLRDYGFRLWKEGSRFRRERGLLTRSQVVAPLRRVQLAKVKTSFPRRRLGYFELLLQTLGGALDDASGRQSVAPFANRAELAMLLSEAGGYRLPDPGSLTRVSSRRLWKKLAPLLIPALALSIVSLVVPFAILGLVLVALLAAHAAVEWRFYRYALAADFLFVANGVWSQTLWIAPRGSAQTISLRRSLLQRLLGLATVIVDTAGAPARDPLRIADLREPTARSLVEALRRSRLDILSPPVAPEPGSWAPP